MKKYMSLLIITCSLLIAACNKPPYETPYYVAGGYVIGRETCKNDEKKDYWLINITSSSSARQQFGDTVTLNGIEYTNVIKSTGLDDKLKMIGQKIGIDFYISDTLVITSGCIAINPITHKLRDANIVRSGGER